MAATVRMHRRVLGSSGQGRPVEGVFFGAEAPGEGAVQLDTLMLGVFHGDEGISAELLNRFIAHLEGLESGQFDGQRHPALIIPVLNPDGLALAQRMTANGVDLNRNYPTANWECSGEGSPYYAGPRPASEPETRLVIDLIETYRPRKIVTVHSPYKVINFDGPGRALAEAMAAHSGYAVVEDIGYPTPGSFGTYAGKERGIPVITLELPPGPNDPPHHDQELPVETLDQVWHDNVEALLAALRFRPG